jgi:hypothetical protein
MKDLGEPPALRAAVGLSAPVRAPQAHHAAPRVLRARPLLSLSQVAPMVRPRAFGAPRHVKYTPHCRAARPCGSPKKSTPKKPKKYPQLTAASILKIA